MCCHLLHVRTFWTFTSSARQFTDCYLHKVHIQSIKSNQIKSFDLIWFDLILCTCTLWIGIQRYIMNHLVCRIDHWCSCLFWCWWQCMLCCLWWVTLRWVTSINLFKNILNMHVFGKWLLFWLYFQVKNLTHGWNSHIICFLSPHFHAQRWVNQWQWLSRGRQNQSTQSYFWDSNAAKKYF